DGTTSRGPRYFARHSSGEIETGTTSSPRIAGGSRRHAGTHSADRAVRADAGAGCATDSYIRVGSRRTVNSWIGSGGSSDAGAQISTGNCSDADAWISAGSPSDADTW